MTARRVLPVDASNNPQCRVCGCSVAQPCARGCHRVELDLCSACKAHVSYYVEWLSTAHKPNPRAFLAEVRARQGANYAAV